jgi:hypothetical protein
MKTGIMKTVFMKTVFTVLVFAMVSCADEPIVYSQQEKNFLLRICFYHPVSFRKVSRWRDGVPTLFTRPFNHESSEFRTKVILESFERTFKKKAPAKEQILCIYPGTWYSAEHTDWEKERISSFLTKNRIY